MSLAFDSLQLNLPSIVLVVILFILFYNSSVNNFWKKRNVPHIQPWPIFGNFFQVFIVQKSIGQCLYEIYKKARGHDYFGFFIFSKPALLINNPDIIKHILVKDFSHFVNRNMNISYNVDTIGHDNLFANCSPRWRKYRGNISPIFTSGKIKYMFNLVEEVAKDLVEKVNQEINKHGNEVEIKELNARYTTDVICTTVFGVKANCLLDPQSKFRHFGKQTFENSYGRTFQFITIFLLPSLANLLRFKLFSNKATKFLSDSFWDVITFREKNKTERKDLVDLLIQLKNKGNIDRTNMDELDRLEVEKAEANFLLTRSEILSAAVTFFSAGFETTASAMTYILYELALHQDIQEKVRKELLDLIADEGSITYNVIQEAKLLGGCFDEALRKYPLLPFLDRKCNETFRVPDTDLIIEKGTKVYMSLDGLQNDPKYFPNPEKFDPERFIDERKSGIHPFAYMPFGQGPRNCIGMRFGIINAKNGLAHIITNFKVTPSAKTPKKIEFTHKGLLNSPKSDLEMIFTPLNTSR